jgi:hypothetical protein
MFAESKVVATQQHTRQKVIIIMSRICITQFLSALFDGVINVYDSIGNAAAAEWRKFLMRDHGNPVNTFGDSVDRALEAGAHSSKIYETNPRSAARDD